MLEPTSCIMMNGLDQKEFEIFRGSGYRKADGMPTIREVSPSQRESPLLHNHDEVNDETHRSHGFSPMPEDLIAADELNNSAATSGQDNFLETLVKSGETRHKLSECVC